MAGSAVVGVGNEVDDALATVAAWLPEADDRAVLHLVADLVTLPATFAAVIGAAVEIDALAAATRIGGTAGVITGATVRRIALQVVASAVALGQTVAAAAAAAHAARSPAALIVPGARLPGYLAGGRCTFSSARQPGTQRAGKQSA